MKTMLKAIFGAALLMFIGLSGKGVAEDLFTTYRIGLDSPYVNGFAVTTHDTNALTNVARALYVGVGGIIKMTLLSGDVITLSNVQSGSMLTLRPTIIWASVTTATDMVGLY